MYFHRFFTKCVPALRLVLSTKMASIKYLRRLSFNFDFVIPKLFMLLLLFHNFSEKYKTQVPIHRLNTTSNSCTVNMHKLPLTSTKNVFVNEQHLNIRCRKMRTEMILTISKEVNRKSLNVITWVLTIGYCNYILFLVIISARK